MGLVKSKNTKPEMTVRRFLHSQGFRFRVHEDKLPGSPDIILKKYRAAILVHGCFWHGHKSKACKLARIPKSNVKFWEEKISGNAVRDRRNKRELKRLGWNVIEVWECDLKKESTFFRIVERICSSD